MKILCDITTLVNIIVFGKHISGHSFVLWYENDDVQILRCVECGYESVGYYKSFYAD